VVRLDDLAQPEPSSQRDWCELILPGDTPVREALRRMQETGCDVLGVETPNRGLAVLSKEDLVTGLLDELDEAEARLQFLERQIEGSLAEQMDLVQESVRTLMQTSRSKLNLAVHQLAEGLILLNGQGQVESANPAAWRLLGLGEGTAGGVLGVALESVGIVDRIRGADSSGVGGRCEHRMDDGRTLEFRWRAMHDEWGHFLGHVVLVRDLSEQVAAAQAKSAFVAAISHELCTPLTGLQGGLSNLLAGVAGRLGRRARRYLEAMDGDCRRLAGLVHELVDMARLQAGLIPLNRCVWDTGLLVEPAVRRAAEAAAAKGLRLDFEWGDGMCPVHADPQRIGQVVDKLISNAIRFTPAGGRVGVSVSRSGEQVVIEVEDTGAGIGPEQRERVFETFYQGRRQTGPGFQGSGLGLAICRGLIEAHGGRIELDSEEGRGSRFAVRLPIAEPYVVLGEHIERLIRDREGAAAEGFALVRIRLEVAGGSDGACEQAGARAGCSGVIGRVERALTRWMLESLAGLSGSGDCVVQCGRAETAIIIAQGRCGRAAARWRRMEATLHEELAKIELNEGLIVPMVGSGLWPEEADDPAELERVVRRRMGPLERS